MDSRQKQITYAEGLIDGFHSAQRIIESMSNGFLTLKEPPAITEWRRRVERMKDDLSNERAQRSAGHERGECERVQED